MSQADATPSDHPPGDEPAEEPVQQTPGKKLNTPLAYLRTFIIVLVVAQHAALPYHLILPPPPASSLAEHYQTMHAFAPVNDAQRSDLLSLFATFNDGFMMALLFFVSGLFVWRSLEKRGRTGFLNARLIRLGVPLVAMAAIRPLTHIPTYLQAGGDGGLADFWQQWSAVAWRGGPIWFLEVLLVFNIVLVLVAGLRTNVGGSLERSSWDVLGRPVRAFALFVLLSAVAYVPVTAAIGASAWQQWGPAQVEVNRLLLYALYFVAGVALGAYGIDRTFLVPGSSLARRWAIWVVAALVAFAISLVVAIQGENEVLIALLYALSCATSSLAFLALFLRFAGTQRRALDSLFRNSYGIYVIHYGVLAWLSYAVLEAQLPAMAKWAVVFAAGLAICWGVTAAVRRIPWVARVI